MSEALDFSLRLVDAASGPAKKIADSLKQVQSGADKAQTALNKGLARQFEQVGFAAARAARKQEQAFAASWAKIGMAAQRAQQRAHREHERMIEKQKEHSLLGGIKEGFGINKIIAGAFVGSMLAEGVIKVGESLVEGAKMAVEVITDGVKDAFKAAGKEQTARVGERNTLGVEGAKGFREDAEKFAKLTPFNDSEIRAMMLPLRRAGLSQAASRQAFATATDIGGGDQGAVGGILEQFKRIYTKQGVNKKQLVDLLGNVGETIPQFYKELGKKMKVSAKTAEKKAADGAVDPQLLMNMITSAQNKKQGGAAGTGGKNFADTFEVRWKKIKDLPEEFFKKLVDSPGFDRASEMLGHLLDNLSPDSPAGQRILASFDSMFEKITGYIGDPKETADALASGIESAIGLTGDLIATAKDLADAFLPSLRTIEDMTFALRLAIATTKGDDAVAKVNNEYANVVENRGIRLRKKFEEENYKNSDVGKLYASTGLNPVMMAGQGSSQAKQGGKVIHLHVHPGAVQVHPAAGEDPTHAHHEAGEKLKRHVQGALEQAAQEAGG